MNIQAINSSENMELLFAYSRNQKKIFRFAKKYDIQGFTDWNKFIKEKELDVVSICTSNGTYLDLVKK